MSTGVALRQGRRHAPSGARSSLRLLNGFELLRDGTRLDVQPRGQRLLALLALRDRPLPRSYVAAQLWLAGNDEHALASLRSTLWRLNRGGAGVTVVDRAGHLQLAEGIGVDVRDMVAQARRLLDDRRPLAVGDEDPTALCCQLLPGWWDDWVVTEREWLRQLQLHALEGLARRLLRAHRYAQALEAGLAAVAGEPLRESAQRVVIDIHLAEGNSSEALRQYERYRRLLGHELGGAPTQELQRLIAGIRTTPTLGATQQ